MVSKDHMQKILESDLAFSHNQAFLVLKKAKIMMSHQGIVVRLSMEETMIRQNKVRTTYLVILKFSHSFPMLVCNVLWENHKY